MRGSFIVGEKLVTPEHKYFLPTLKIWLRGLKIGKTRIWSRRKLPFIKVTTSGCWLWQNNINDAGYGILTINHIRTRVYRFVYKLTGNKIPKNLEPDHLCRNRSCCNPFHLEWVTHKVNTLRGKGLVPNYAKRDRCSHGHLFTKENTAHHKHYPGRKCRACVRNWAAKYRKRRDEGKIPSPKRMV
jgi:hypothetical protein